MRNRVVIRGLPAVVARTMADAGIPFAFDKQAGPNTVGFVSSAYLDKLFALLDERPELEGRFAKLNPNGG